MAASKNVQLARANYVSCNRWALERRDLAVAHMEEMNLRVLPQDKCQWYAYIFLGLDPGRDSGTLCEDHNWNEGTTLCRTWYSVGSDDNGLGLCVRDWLVVQCKAY